MKKINEQTKSFLLYGIEDVIKPKEIYKLDGAILFHRKKDPTQGGRLTSLVLAGILSLATEDAEM